MLDPFQRRKKQKAWGGIWGYLPASGRGEKLSFLASPSFLSIPKSFPRGRLRASCLPPSLLRLQSFDILPWPSTYCISYSKGIWHPQPLPFPFLPLKGAPLLGNRPDSHGPCHKDPQSGHSHAHCRQLTQINGPALPPALRSFLLPLSSVSPSVRWAASPRLSKGSFHCEILQSLPFLVSTPMAAQGLLPQTHFPRLLDPPCSSGPRPRPRSSRLPN